ncbi:hypothetical protein AZI86_09540 [Bdellovibrio bacteriovorus]|uniref:Uncharacterized protein n=1 Tax=Bdellovibrio bacteriovorus TaxID=959 RepID=A0A150WS90_BDEBC|nr:hypothetical protein [Bdellovibrio bacteriovorus]KYG67238.1 hypothetical protein AZI86_09540 [Bdellovibrio bacteriovorus]
MEKVSWIKDLVKAEQQMEESGLVDMTFGFDSERVLVNESVQFLLALKTEFVDASTSFNELKSSALGRIKIYGIAKTHADFMLFRNGFKMIFSLKAPGQISIRFNFIGTNYIPAPGSLDSAQTTTTVMDEHILEAKWGAFGEIIWTYQGLPAKLEYMVRHYMTLFIKESSK